MRLIHAANYVALFLPDSNNCFFICLVPYIPICLYYFLILCFYFHLFFVLFAPRDTFYNLQCLIWSLQSARNISEIRNISQSNMKKNCRVNYNQPNALTFSWNKVFCSSSPNYFLFSFSSGYRLKNLLWAHFNEHS